MARQSIGGGMRRLSALAVTVLASSALMAASPASAQRTSGMASEVEQVPASAYARAEALLPQHVRKLIPGLSVRPRWIGETSRFWFEKQTRDGREYLLVDAALGTSQPLFDHGALIGALAGATGKPIERNAFQLPALRVDKKTGTLRFSYGGKSWQYDPNERGLRADTDTLGRSAESPDGA